MVAGQVPAASVRGARLVASAACSGRACRSDNDVQRLVLWPQPGSRTISMTVQALDLSTAGRAADRQYRHVWLDQGRLAWHALAARPVGAVPLAQPAPKGTISDRHGAVLWTDGAPTVAAQAAGLAPLVGLAPDHASSIGGMLARAAPGRTRQATLTLDAAWQALGQAIVDCQGLRHGRWDGTRCHDAAAMPPGRRAGLVLLDADNGDVLVAAGGGAGNVSAANWREVRDFDRNDPARSPLRLPALQHDGGAHNSPGSTFKIISALGLERAARDDRQLEALLDGASLASINATAARRGYAFRTDAAIYPDQERQAHITNYHGQSLERRASAGRLGLAQALTYSLNTWFAWSAELSDHTLFGKPDGGAPGLQALEAGALDQARPILAAARQLGFERPLRLDGGLLPSDFAWQPYDALQATPAHIDPVQTRHELRQMAIGLRMQATPLQMALAAAAIGNGRLVQPRLLLALDGQAAVTVAEPALAVRLDRIRAGMKGVVDSGTAAAAFAGPALAPLRPGLYGKTGTAPVTADDATVWFTGWLEAGSLPGQTRRLAFAAFVSHAQGTGGEHAAPMVATLLAGLAPPAAEGKAK
jgi:cell division protein FtsI/penicillin-binding protein 2